MRISIKISISFCLLLVVAGMTAQRVVFFSQNVVGTVACSFSQTQAPLSNNSCGSATTCAVTGTLGANHLVVVSTTTDANVHPVSIDKGGLLQNVLWNNANRGTLSVAEGYIYPSSAATTPITVTFDGTTGGAQVDIREYTPSAGCTPNFDAAQQYINHTVTSDQWAGATLTLAGTSDVIVQTTIPATFVTAVTSPYNTNQIFGGSGGDTGGGTGDSINTASGAAPTWTMSATGSNNAGAGIAFGFNLATSTITPDNQSEAVAVGTGTTVSWTHFIGAGSHAALLVGTISDKTASGCTYNSVSMTSISGPTQDGGTTFFGSLFILANPAAGSHTVTCTFSSAVSTGYGIGMSFFGVNQSTPNRTAPTPTTDGGSCPATAASITVSNAQSGDMVVDFLESDTITALASLTSNHVPMFMSSHPPPSGALNVGTAFAIATGSTTMTWTPSAGFCWSYHAAALIPG